MCGINGIFAYHSASSEPDESELLTTRDHMYRRGPDGSGAWWSTNRRCALGHRRLAILDLADRASQPMTSEDGRFIIVFNGEIYNYPHIRTELEAQAVCFRTTSDTEALLHLYARHGPEMVHRLRGMFAFAIWDVDRKGLFLARDPYGIKPIYTANDGWTFRFASQVKALLAGGGISRDLEPAGVVGFHLFGSVPEPFTLYRDVRALPAGHTQWIDAAGPREPRAYTRLACVLAQRARDPIPAREIDERVRDSVFDSVRAHLLSDVEVGIFLSGGVDSGAVLGLMRDAGQGEIRAITLAFEEFRGTSEDEVPLAALVSERYGASHFVRYVSEGEFVSDLPAILDAMDQPSIDGINSWFVSKVAKEIGLKVVLSGLGGDEILAGYPSFEDVPCWLRRFGPVASVPGLGLIARKLIPVMLPALAQTRPKALGLLESTRSWAGTYLLRRGLFLPHELNEIVGIDMAREGLRRLQPLQRLSASLVPDPGSDMGRVCVLESTHYMRNQLLRDIDWAGMAHSVEVRVPLVDSSLLANIAPIVPALAPATGKAALARAPTVPLPAQVVNRSKTGFGVPTAAWMAAVSGASKGRVGQSKGLASRDWSRVVLDGTINGSPQPGS